MLNTTHMKYYNDDGLGVVGVYPQHQDGVYTFLVGRALQYSWIKTKDLYDTYDEAKQAPFAQFD